MVGKSPHKHRSTRVLNATKPKLPVDSPTPGHHPPLLVSCQAVELTTSHPNCSTKTWHQPRCGTACHRLANPQLAEPVVSPGVDSGLRQSQAVLLSSGNLGHAQAWKSLEQGDLGTSRKGQTLLVRLRKHLAWLCRTCVRRTLAKTT